MFEARQIGVEDWAVLKEVRLRALASDPAVFGSTLEKEAGLSAAEWRAFLSNPDRGVFILYEDSKPVGMTGIRLSDEDAERGTGMMWGSWIEPRLRGKGLSDLLYKARIGWAERHPTCMKIIVGHREGNVASKQANQKQGFKYTHSQSEKWHGGRTENVYFYELAVDKKNLVTPPLTPSPK